MFGGVNGWQVDELKVCTVAGKKSLANGYILASLGNCKRFAKLSCRQTFSLYDIW